MELKYRVIERGKADGLVPFPLVYIDKKDVEACGLSYLEAFQTVAKDFKNDCCAADIIDTNAVTVSSDGIMGDAAVVAFASIDHGKINKDFGFISVSEMPYREDICATEPHMKQWSSEGFAGKRLYRGPNFQDKGFRNPHNESMTMTGRIANNNTGSEMMNLVEMTEILVPCFGMNQIMKDGDVMVGVAGADISVGIGMVVYEKFGRIFHQSYGAGQTAHNSGEYAKTVKSDYPAVVAPKPVHAAHVLKALEIGLVVGKDLGCSPVNMCIAHAGGFEIALDNITDRAWVELNSVGITKEEMSKPSPKMSHDEIIAKAEEILPGMPTGKIYKYADIVTVKYVEV